LFQPGNKLGVGYGRPKGSSRPMIIREWVEREGWQKLIDLARGKGHGFRQHDGKVVEIGPKIEVQLEAMKLAFAYGFGKPTEMEPPSRDPAESKLRVETMLELLNKLEARPAVPVPNGNGNGSGHGGGNGAG
jgi:hypothetical protein